MSDPFASLRRPGVFALIFGRMLSALGRQMFSVAIGWELYERTHSALSLGFVGLVQIIPVVLLVLPAGAASDRFDRRRVAFCSQFVLVTCFVTLALASYLEAPVEVIYAILFVQGAGVAFLAPASASIIPTLVPYELFTNVNIWRSTTFQVASVAGPSAAGFVIAATGGAIAVYAIAAIAGLVFCGILLTIPDPIRAGTADSSANRVDFREGVRFVFRSPPLLAALTLDMFAVLFGGATALLPVFAKDVLEVGPSGLGWLRAAPAIGGLLVAIAQAKLPPWQRPGRVILYVVAGFGMSTMVFGLSRGFVLSFLCLIAIGIFDNISVIIRATLEQVLTPDRLRGRVGAVHYVFIGLANELGEFESGFVAWLIGPILAVVTGGAGTLLIVAFVLWRWPELTRIGPLHTLRPNER